MEKRALLAFVLSLAILIGYQYLFVPAAPDKREVPEPPVAEAPPQQGPEQRAVVEMPVEEAREAPPPAVLPWQSSERRRGDGPPEEIVTVETELVRYRISTRDGTLKEITLKRYLDDSAETIQLVPTRGELFPLQLLANGEVFHVTFKPSRQYIEVTDKAETLVLTYQDETGVRIEKHLEFQPASYQIKVRIVQNALEEYQLLAGSVFQGAGDANKGSGRYAHEGPVLELSGEIERIKFKEAKERMILRGEIPWVAFEEKYFMTAVLPENPAAAAVVDRLDSAEGTNIGLGVTGGGETASYVFYAGPKDYELLRSLNNGLEKAINFGFFGILGKPMFFVLKAIYGVVRNYGVAIILLTSLIKVVFIPLTHKQQKSMQDMQKIQPEISAIRERYKGDAQNMNRHVMELYKKHKVNPAAGCLPLVIQIPVFFALYNVLLSAIELRQAPFLYIKDLSAADTLFGHIGGFAIGPLPLLMGASMYLQQKMMPTTMDPKQAKIFQYMPVIFTFMFLNFPSGLVLYWLVNNVLTIGQQMYSNKRKAAATA
jgi:YidC/Oxa1 family membrane protein insertase